MAFATGPARGHAKQGAGRETWLEISDAEETLKKVDASDCLSVKMRKLIFSLWFFDEILMNPIRLLHCTHHFGVKLSFAVHLMWPISTPLTCRVGNLNLCDSTFACPGNRPKVARAQGLQEFINASRSRLGLHPFPIHFHLSLLLEASNPTKIDGPMVHITSLWVLCFKSYRSI